MGCYRWIIRYHAGHVRFISHQLKLSKFAANIGKSLENSPALKAMKMAEFKQIEALNYDFYHVEIRWSIAQMKISINELISYTFPCIESGLK